MDVAYVRDTQLNMRPTLLKLQHMLLCTSQHQPLASAALYAMGLLTLAWPFRAVNSKHKQSNKHCCSATRLRHHTSGHNSHKGEQIHTSKFVDAIFDPSNRKENAGCGSPTAETRPSLRAISRIIGCTSLQHAPQTRPVVTGGRSQVAFQHSTSQPLRRLQQPWPVHKALSATDPCHSMCVTRGLTWPPPKTCASQMALLVD
jgi:hypothetical protein